MSNTSVLNEDFDIVFKAMIELAERSFTEVGEICPSLLVLPSKRVSGPGQSTIAAIGVVPVVEFQTGPEGKSLISRLMQTLCADEEVSVVGYISEGWFVKGTHSLDCLPSEHPLREEVVMLNLISANQQAFAVWEMNRTENGVTFEPSPLNFLGDGIEVFGGLGSATRGPSEAIH